MNIATTRLWPAILLALLSGTAAAAQAELAPPAPRFDWIAPGEARPAPRIPSVEVPCFDDKSLRPATEACLNRQWRALLDAFDQHPLTAPQGGRSYRVVWLRSFHAPMVMRIDVEPAGNGRLTVAWGRRERNGWGYEMVEPARTSRIPASDVRTIEQALDANGFTTLIADESSVPEEDQLVCNDGAEWVIEAVVDGRYRYVDGGCRRDNDQILAMGGAFIDLAKARLPDPRLDPVY